MVPLKNDTKDPSDPTGTYYCQVGDHLVDEVVWLEQITLGCKPCMIKMRDSIFKDCSYKPRLWSVTPTGIARVDETPPPQLPPSPFRPARSTPKTYIFKHQDWTCTQCGRSFDNAEAGFLNTVLGFVCKTCNHTRKMDGPKRTTVQRQADQLRENEERARQAQSSLERINTPAVSVEKHTGTQTKVRKATLFPGQTIIVTGTSATFIAEGDVPNGCNIVITGTATVTHVKGDVLPGGRIVATGTGTVVIVDGYVHDNGAVVATGTRATITHHGKGPCAHVLATGTNARMTDLGGKSKRVSVNDIEQMLIEKLQETTGITIGMEERKAVRAGAEAIAEAGATQEALEAAVERMEVIKARSALADKFGLEYPAEWLDAKAQMTPGTRKLMSRDRAKTYSIDEEEDGEEPVRQTLSCVGCGKQVLRPANWAANISRCGDCWRQYANDQGGYTIPAQLPDGGLIAAVQTHVDLPRNPKDGERAYVMSDNKLWRFEGKPMRSWVQVPLPTRKLDERPVSVGLRGDDDMLYL